MAVLSFFANPHRFMAASKWFAWGFTLLGAALIAIGVWKGLFVVPPEDHQQDDSARMMFVHVPAMWLSLFAYAFMVGASLISIVWRHAIADVAAKSAAPIGAVVTAHRPDDRINLGLHDMGHVVGVGGCAPRLRARAVLHLSWLHRDLAGDGNAAESRARRRYPLPCRRGEHADHPLLGRMVCGAPPAAPS
jgi:hypothetical protein